MKISDIISLAKAGYTPADVRDFLKAAESDVPEKKTEDKPDKDPEAKPEDKVEEKKAAKSGASQESNKDEPEREIDYKSKYEEVAEALRLAQAANNHQPIDVKPDRTADEILEDFLKDSI